MLNFEAVINLTAFAWPAISGHFHLTNFYITLFFFSLIKVKVLGLSFTRLNLFFD